MEFTQFGNFGDGIQHFGGDNVSNNFLLLHKSELNVLPVQRSMCLAIMTLFFFFFFFGGGGGGAVKLVV